MSFGVLKWGWFSSAMSRATWGWVGGEVSTGGFTPVAVVPAMAFKAAPVQGKGVSVKESWRLRAVLHAGHAGGVNKTAAAAYKAGAGAGEAPVSRSGKRRCGKAEARTVKAKSGRRSKQSAAAKAVINNQKP